MRGKEANLTTCVFIFVVSLLVSACGWQAHTETITVTVDTVDVSGAHVEGGKVNINRDYEQSYDAPYSFSHCCPV